MEFKIYNNLFGKKIKLPEELLKNIHKTVCNSILSDEEIYSKEQKKKMIKARYFEKYKEMLNESWIICAFDKGNLLGFCGIGKRNGKYEYKILQVLPTARGLGLARMLTDIRDEEAWNMGIRNIQITSLCFPKTIDFHFKRGFQISGDQTGLSHSIRMEKKLEEPTVSIFKESKIYPKIERVSETRKKIFFN